MISFAQFVRRTLPGRIFLSCCLIRSTNNQSIVRVELTGAEKHSKRAFTPENGDGSTCHFVLTFSDFRKERGLSQPAISPSLVVAPVPDREKDCKPIVHGFMDKTPMTKKFKYRAPFRPEAELWGHHVGGKVRDMWICLADGSMIDAHAATLFTDLVCTARFVV